MDHKSGCQSYDPPHNLSCNHFTLDNLTGTFCITSLAARHTILRTTFFFCRATISRRQLLCPNLAPRQLWVFCRAALVLQKWASLWMALFYLLSISVFNGAQCALPQKVDLNVHSPYMESLSSIPPPFPHSPPQNQPAKNTVLKKWASMCASLFSYTFLSFLILTTTVCPSLLLGQAL